MDALALSTKVFAGKLIHIAVYGSGTSDAVTKPISSSNLWKELLACKSATHKPIVVSEPYDTPDPDTGWREELDEYTVGDEFSLTSRYTTGLYEQLRYGLAGPIVQGTPQTPFVKSDRSVLAWINAQERLGNGQDWNVAALWCRIWAGEPPAVEKKTQEPMLRVRVLKSSLNSINWPA